MTKALWNPLGAARAMTSQLTPAQRASFPDALVACARRADLGEEHLHLAWELVQLTGAVDADGQRGLLVLLLLLFDATARGSTRLPLGRSERALLAERARALGLDADDEARAHACADAVLRAFERDDGRSEGEAGTSTFGLLIGRPGAFRPLTLDGTALAPQRLDALEARLASRLLARRAPPRSEADETALRQAVASVLAAPALGRKGPVVLTDEQQGAVEAALRAPVCVISGGPGTGKTAIVVSMLRALERVDPGLTVALAAPTGKAADRMARSIEAGLAGLHGDDDVALRARVPAARTLHRLLGWSPSLERFRHDERSPLAERVVIVDEASMIDLAMMDRLVAALPPSGRLVLLGDADQLPSVDPGCVLFDLVQAGHTSGLSVQRLTKSHRMDPSDPAGSHILGIARRVHDGVASGLESAPDGALGREGMLARRSALPEDGRVPPGVSLVPATRDDQRERFLAWWWEHRVRGPEAPLFDRTFRPGSSDDGPLLGRLFDRLEASRLLCATRGRPTGTDAVNAWMGERAARARGLRPGPLLLAGESVMVVRNDHEAGLYNGDQGLVLWVEGHDGAAHPCLVVRRGHAFEVHRIERVRGLLERAYATTVHKAQGSEHDCVALLLPDEDVPRLLTREIVYTGITRARSAVLLVGQPQVFQHAVSRATARSTGLQPRLRREGSLDPGVVPDPGGR